MKIVIEPVIKCLYGCSGRSIMCPLMHSPCSFLVSYLPLWLCSFLKGHHFPLCSLMSCTHRHALFPRYPFSQFGATEQSLCQWAGVVAATWVTPVTDHSLSSDHMLEETQSEITELMMEGFLNVEPLHKRDYSGGLLIMPVSKWEARLYFVKLIY